MGQVREIHGPWRVTSGHPDSGEHVGYALSVLASGEVDSTGEAQEVPVRRASCSCGWSGPEHAPPAADEALRTRRYRRHTREVLRPEWEGHVAQWLPEPLAAEEDHAPAPPSRHLEPVPEPVEVEPATEEGPAVEEPAEEPNPVATLAAAATEAHATARAASEAQERLTAAVRGARRAGQSWARVGALVGMTRQAAHERWRTL